MFLQVFEPIHTSFSFVAIEIVVRYFTEVIKYTNMAAESDSCKPSAYWLNLKARLRGFKALWTKLQIFDHSIVWQFPET